jgi:hypothetical protein
MPTTVTPIPFTTPLVTHAPQGIRLGLGPAARSHAPHPGRVSHAYYPLTSGRRMNHGLICGAAGYGRHNLAAVLVASARAAMPLATVYLDAGIGAVAAPALARTATLALRDAAAALDTLERVVALREQLLAGLRAPHFRAAELPALLVVLDDVEGLVTAATAERWCDLAQRSPYLGLGFLTLSHTFTAAEFSSKRLRALLAGNVVAFNPRSACLFPPQAGLHDAAPGRGRLTDIDDTVTTFDAFYLGDCTKNVLSTYRDSPLDPRTQATLSGAVTA